MVKYFFFSLAVMPRYRKLCTILFIPAGGFHEGHAHDLLFNPEPFMECEEIVFVTINYRVGVFGFMDLETKEFSGNMGLKDALAALKFVHKHIDRFGGDPSCITVFGISSGNNSYLNKQLECVKKYTYSSK